MLSNLFSWISSLRRPTPSSSKLDLGERGEKWAARHLRRHGYKVLLRHFRSRHGEIDVVCRHKDVLVFVEVKTRTSEAFGQPAEAVNREKQRHLTKLALDYLRLLHNPEIKFRFDIVEVVWPKDARQPTVTRIIENAFDLSEPYVY